MKALNKHSLPVAMILVALILVPAGGAKLAGVPAVHASFAELGLPSWFGYFIGACEVAGSIGIFVRRLSSLAAAGISIIMLGALYYHASNTPLTQGIPALVVLLLCIFIIIQRRGMTFQFR